MIAIVYFNIALIMFLVFGIVLVGIPAIMYIKLAIDTSLGDSDDEFTNPYLEALDELMDTFDWTYTDERVIKVGISLVVLSIFWVFGIFIVWYMVDKLVKKVKNDEYDRVVNNKKGR